MCECMCTAFGPVCAPLGAMNVSIYSRWRVCSAKGGPEGPTRAWNGMCGLSCLSFGFRPVVRLSRPARFSLW